MGTAEEIAPPDGFELDTPNPPEGFALDSTPAPPEGFALDVQGTPPDVADFQKRVTEDIRRHHPLTPEMAQAENDYFQRMNTPLPPVSVGQALKEGFHQGIEEFRNSAIGVPLSLPGRALKTMPEGAQKFFTSPALWAADKFGSGTPKDVSSGALESLRSVQEGALQPEMVAMGGAGTLPPIAGKLAALGFTADMLSSVPDQWNAVKQAVASGDVKQSTKTIGDLIFTGLFSTMALKHGLSPERTTALREQSETQAADILKPAPEPESVRTPEVPAPEPETPAPVKAAVEQAKAVGLTKSAEALEQTTKGESNAIQEQATVESVLREERPQVELQGVEQQDQLQSTPEVRPQEEVAPAADPIDTFVSNVVSGKLSKTEEGQAFGKTVSTPEGIAKLKAAYAHFKTRAMEGLKSIPADATDEQTKAATDAAFRPQIINEAIEEATGASPFKRSDPAKFKELMDAGQPAKEPELIGMGGAIPSEFEPSGNTATGIRNAQIEAENKAMGKPPIIPALRRTWGEAFDMAMGKLDADLGLLDRLVVELENKPRALNDWESALLAYRRAEMRNEYAKTTRDLAQAFDDAKEFPNRQDEVTRLKERVDQLGDELYEFGNLTRLVGSEQGRGLAARKLMVDEKLTLADMEMELRSAKGGERLTNKERAEVQSLHDEIVAKQKAFDEHMAARDAKIAELESKAAHDELLRQAERDALPNSYIIKVAERIVSTLDKRADAARIRLKERLGRTSAGVDPTVLIDLAEIGASHIGHVGLDFAKWSDKLVADVGEWVKPHLQEVFDESQKYIDQLADSMGGKSDKVKRAVKKTTTSDREESIKSSISEKIKEGKKNGIASLVQRLARSFVEKGIKDRETLIDEVHAVLKAIDPAISRREAMDAISGYGDFKQLSKDQISVELRDLKGQMQQIGKLEDMRAGQAPQKSGVERRTPSDEERRLIQQVEEAKKKGGYKVTDPATQLKSSLDAIKTRLKNSISDLEHQIESKTKTVKEKRGIPYDAEAAALKEKRDKLKEEFDSIFGKPEMTDEQRVKLAMSSVERSIAEYDRRIKAGELSTPKKASKTPETPELTAARARRDALKAQLEEMRDLDASIQAKRLANRESAIDARIEELARQINEGDIASKAGKVATSPELEAKKGELADLQKARTELRKATPEAIAERMAKEDAALDVKIAKIIEDINEGRIATIKNERGEPSNPKVGEFADLLKLRNKMHRAQEGKTPSEKETEAIEKMRVSIDELVRSINEEGGGIAAPKKPSTASPERQALIAERAELNRIRQQLRNAAKPRLTPEEIALKGFKTRTANRIAEMEEAIASGDFTKKPRRELELDAEAAALKAEHTLAKEKYQKALAHAKYLASSKASKVLHGAKEALNLSRSLMTSWDVSAVLRQGGFIGIANPIRAAKSLGPMFRALASEKNATAIMEQIKSRPNASLYERSKLFIAPLETSRLSHMEEAFMSKLADKIPGVGASQRAYVTFLNKLRADSFDSMHDSLTRKGGGTKEELDAIANYINVATGRGNLGKAAAAAETLSTVFFAPRLVASRFQLLAGQPFYRGSFATRSLIAKEYAKYLVGMTVIYGLGKMAGATIEQDPRSSDYGKLKFGNTRVDMLSGLQQATVLLSRLTSGKIKTLKGNVEDIRGDVKFGHKTAADLIAQFLRSKLSPVVGSGIDLASGKNVVGEKVTPGSVAVNSLTPLSMRDIQAAMKEHGITGGLAMAILSLFGAGVQNFDASQKTK